MESYDEYLNEDEYNDMIHAKSVIPVLIVAYREDDTQPTRNGGTTSLLFLKQQAIVAEVKGSVTYMDIKTGRPVDIRTLGGGWPKVFEGFTKKAEHAKMLNQKWDSDRPKNGKKMATSKI
ncbi:hypothetical protein P171DRAFT_485371 [Karstenula rhodostoma CBS 690.94]|uniref:Uncharacterized protein n=1 Tax=Karstenula rhodostoma CBS 690.94 TaxID=1392251 RepID=A0A9P4UCK6_9PLEO|nr:hypothetical protein P171DRAFT_485371 [Karstenula rhodostoma CBS 690.94]